MSGFFYCLIDRVQGQLSLHWLMRGLVSFSVWEILRHMNGFKKTGNTDAIDVSNDLHDFFLALTLLGTMSVSAPLT